MKKKKKKKQQRAGLELSHLKKSLTKLRLRIRVGHRRKGKSVGWIESKQLVLSLSLSLSIKKS